MVEFNLGGYTNGKLLVVAQMVSPPFELIDLVATRLQPLGFLEKDDNVFADEELIRGVGYEYTPNLNKPHPDCEGVSWLGSIISKRGNLVWHLEEVKKPDHLYKIIPL